MASRTYEPESDYRSLPVSELILPEASTTNTVQHSSDVNPGTKSPGKPTSVMQRPAKSLRRLPLAMKSSLFTLRRLPITLYRLCRRYPVIAIVMFCLVVIFAILLATLFAVTFNAKNQTIAVISSGAANSGIIFLGHIYKIDLTRRDISISWLIIGCGDDFKIAGSTTYGLTYCGRPAVPIDIYIDGSASVNASYDPSKMPLVNSARYYLQSVNEFQTTQLLDIDGGHIGIGPRDSTFYDAAYGFPWDSYTMQTVFLAVNHLNNATLPILRLAPVDFADNFSPSFNDFETTSDFNGTSAVASRTVTLKLQRSPLTKTFNMLIFLVNWLLAGMVLFITVVAFWWNRTNMPDALVLLPITVILTVPSLRALMVGAPSFGILLDAIGLFPQMIIVSICSFLLLFAISLKQINKELPNSETASENFN